MNNRKDNPWHFTKMERTGLIIFLALLFIIVLFWRIEPHLIKPEKEENEHYRLAWEKFKAENLEVIPAKEKYQYTSTKYYKPSSKAKKEAHLFKFDPNTATEKELTTLGLSLRTARTLIHYRNKGGKFYKKEDLKKLYTLSSEDYQRIAPYVAISLSKPEKPVYKKNKNSFEPNYPKTPAIIPLNKTDAATLVLLPGIGPVFSKRIIAFRDALGGFSSVQQLKEVYGFPDSTFQQLKDRFTVDPGIIRKINVNTANKATLEKHPYINQRIARNIIILRKELKKFSNIAQLKQVPLINEEKYRKIAPYLKVE